MILSSESVAFGYMVSRLFELVRHFELCVGREPTAVLVHPSTFVRINRRLRDSEHRGRKTRTVFVTYSGSSLPIEQRMDRSVPLDTWRLVG